MFLTKLVTSREIEKDYWWVLEQDLVYQTPKYIIVIKEGFDFDFASIPTFMRGILPKNGVKYDRASCLHDALFASNALPFTECNNLFKQACIEDGVDYITTNVMYWAIKIFSKVAYESDPLSLEKYKKLVSVQLLTPKVYNVE